MLKEYKLHRKQQIDPYVQPPVLPCVTYDRSSTLVMTLCIAAILFVSLYTFNLGSEITLICCLLVAIWAVVNILFLPKINKTHLSRNRVEAYIRDKCVLSEALESFVFSIGTEKKLLGASTYTYVIDLVPKHSEKRIPLYKNICTPENLKDIMTAIQKQTDTSVDMTFADKQAKADYEQQKFKATI